MEEFHAIELATSAAGRHLAHGMLCLQHGCHWVLATTIPLQLPYLKAICHGACSVAARWHGEDCES